MIRLRATRGFKQALAVLEQLPEREPTLRQWVVNRAAAQVYATMLDLLPHRADHALYRRSLQLATVRGLSDGESAVAIRAQPKMRKVKSLKSDATLLYVKAKAHVRDPKSAVRILERYSPWTVGTLPFYPDRKRAVVVSQRSNEGEVQRVARQRARDRRHWRRELVRAGVRVTSKQQEIKIPRRAKAMPDVAFEGLRLEFGIGGTRAVPHWRPAIRRMMKIGLPGLRRDPFLRALMTSLHFAPARLKSRIRATLRQQDAVAFKGFQRKLSIR